MSLVNLTNARSVQFFVKNLIIVGTWESTLLFDLCKLRYSVQKGASEFGAGTPSSMAGRRPGATP